MISGISGSEDPHNSLVSPDIAVFLRFSSKWVLFRFSLLSRMALRLLFQRLFDASSDSDIPKNVPFTFVINTLLLS